MANYENLIVEVFSPLFLLAQVKRVDYKVDNMEGYAQWSLTRSCETVKYKNIAKGTTDPRVEFWLTKSLI